MLSDLQDVPVDELRVGVGRDMRLTAPAMAERYARGIADESADVLDVALDKEELLHVFEPGLRKHNPRLSYDWIKQSWRFREPAGQPVVLPNHPERIPPDATPARGLYLANTTQDYPDDRGTNYAVREAEEALRELLAREREALPAGPPRRSHK